MHYLPIGRGAAAYIRSRLLELQCWHAGTQFDRWCVPPRASGVRWCQVSPTPVHPRRRSRHWPNGRPRAR